MAFLYNSYIYVPIMEYLIYLKNILCVYIIFILILFIFNLFTFNISIFNFLNGIVLL